MGSQDRSKSTIAVDRARIAAVAGGSARHQAAASRIRGLASTGAERRLKVAPGIANRATRDSAGARRLLRSDRTVSSSLFVVDDGDPRAPRRQIVVACPRPTRPCSPPSKPASIACFCLATRHRALAYGAHSAARRQRSFGPGNRWVSAAKSLVSSFGDRFLRRPDRILIVPTGPATPCRRSDRTG